MVDVLTLNYNDADTTIDFVHSVENYGTIGHILIVDNCSTDDSYQRLKEMENQKIRLIRTDHNGGYGAGNNFGIRYLAQHNWSNYVLQCNPDVLISENTIITLYSFLKKHNEYVMAAPFMLNKKGERVSNTAFPLATKWQYILSLDIVLNKFLRLNTYENLSGETDEYKEVGAVAGSLFMMNLKKMIDGGMYDENIFLYCEEMSLGLKLKKAGYKTALLPKETFLHNHSVSISKTFKTDMARRKILTKSKLYVIRKFYRANLCEYSIAWFLSRLSYLEIMLLSLRKNR